jgi:hypothetical protein
VARGIKQDSREHGALLCDGRLAADNRSMMDVVRRARQVTAPADAVATHDLVLRSGDAWIESLKNIELFCGTGNALHKLPAALKFWEAAATLQDAANRFWLLLIAEGVEDWAQRSTPEEIHPGPADRPCDRVWRPCSSVSKTCQVS